MTNSFYGEPVSKLLTLGECRRREQWLDYQALGIGLEHVPDLIRMVQDEELHHAYSESLEVWAPVHAWRALGQLRAERAIEPLIDLLEGMDQDYEQWIGEEVPEILGLIGPAAVPGLAECLVTPHEDIWAQTTVASALSEIGNHHPEARNDCVTALTRGLENFASQQPGLNGFLISSLMDLGAVEVAPLMESAFAADSVDISIMGDWEDVQIELGLLDERQTPKPHYVSLPGWTPPISPIPAEVTGGEQWKEERKVERRRRRKRKAQRKQRKEARRKQRKQK